MIVGTGDQSMRLHSLVKSPVSVNTYKYNMILYTCTFNAGKTICNSGLVNKTAVLNHKL